MVFICLIYVFFKITVLFSTFLITLIGGVEIVIFNLLRYLVFFCFEVTKMFSSIIVFTYIYINSEQTLKFWLGFATQSGRENTN